MDATLWIAKTGLDAQHTRMSVISNNLANVNTMGFKRDRAVFEDLLYQKVRQPGAQTSVNTESPTGMMIGTGTRVTATEKIHTQGNMVQTQGALDIAIDGSGFFQVLRPDNTIGYSRDGAFKMNSEGQLVTANGMLLQPEINIPSDANSITIGADGIISVTQYGQSQASVIGNIQVAMFMNPAGLQPLGQNLYAETGSSGTAQLMTPSESGAGQLMQGALEASNVNVVEEMVNMIEAQRAYEVNSKSIAAADQMLKFVNNNL
jgi:flagellar basal-body rod protein FlgG